MPCPQNVSITTETNQSAIYIRLYNWQKTRTATNRVNRQCNATGTKPVSRMQICWMSRGWRWTNQNSSRSHHNVMSKLDHWYQSFLYNSLITVQFVITKWCQNKFPQKTGLMAYITPFSFYRPTVSTTMQFLDAHRWTNSGKKLGSCLIHLDGNSCGIAARPLDLLAMVTIQQKMFYVYLEWTLNI